MEAIVGSKARRRKRKTEPQSNGVTDPQRELRLAEIGSVVASVAHESRNALQRIRARVDLIRLIHPDDSELLTDLAAIEDASLQLQTQFEELREFGAPIVLQQEECDLRQLIQAAWDNVRFAKAYANARLTVPPSSVQVQVDPNRLEQVLRNLFENSLGACREPAQIAIKWEGCERAGSRWLQIFVQDNGPGFTDQQRVAAFTPFFTTKPSGTGLGLAICRRIMHALGGDIDIELCPTGASIKLTLPV